MPKIPTFEYEQQYWDQGISMVAGIDEVGMGALAGPVVAGAVVFDGSGDNAGRELLRDSKTLSAKQREKASLWIKENALSWSIGQASVDEIFEINIRQASHLAMRRAVKALKIKPDILLIDGNPADIHPDIPAVNIIKGDNISCSIAGASILAKVYRDNIMTEMALEYPAYRFDSHKGYASATHKEALATHGVTDHHRKGYAPIASLIRPIPE